MDVFFYFEHHFNLPFPPFGLVKKNLPEREEKSRSDVNPNKNKKRKFLNRRNEAFSEWKYPKKKKRIFLK